MTVPVNSPLRHVYTGDGSQTVFDYDNLIENADVLKVYTFKDGAETLLVRGADYEVSGVGNADGGTITLDVAVPDDDTLVILYEYPIQQPFDLTNSIRVFTTEHEAALDRIVRQILSVSEKVNRALLTPKDGSATGFDTTDYIEELRSLVSEAEAAASAAASSATTTPSSSTITATGSDFARSLAVRFAERINVKDFGAVGDFNVSTFTGTDDTAAIEEAFTYARSLGRKCRIHFPASSGAYYTTGGHKVPGNCFVGGDGMEATEVWFDQDVATTHCFYRDSGDGSVDSIGIGEMTISGSWLKTQSVGSRRDFIQLWRVTNLRFTNLMAENSRHFTISGKYCEQVTFSNCWVEKAARDAFNFTDCRDITVMGGGTRWCHDDAFAAHVSTSPLAPERTTSISITGFHMEDTNGLKLLGAKRLNVNGCISNRARGYACWAAWIDATFSEGYTSGTSINICNNQFHDTLNLQIFGGGDLSDHIIIGSPQPTTGSGAIANLPWLSDTGTGTVIQHYPYLDNNGSASSVVHAGGYDWNISNNICTRTLPTVTSLYSDLGRGNAYAQTGFADLSISTPLYQSNIRGVRLAHSARNCLIQGNNFTGTRRGAIVLAKGSAPDFAFMNISVDHNHVFDGNGFTHDFSADVVCDVKITNNTFDCDPFNLDADRTAGGTWDITGDSFPAGINAAFMQGVAVGGNKYRNCFKAIHTSANTQLTFTGNPEILYCKPVASGASVLNVGISNCPDAGSRYQYVIEEGDPTSSNYRKVLNTCSLSATSVPTTGIYVRGHFVENGAATVDSNNMLILGWKRLTTGSGHMTSAVSPTITTTDGSATATVSSATGLTVGSYVTVGTTVPVGTKIAAIVGTTITLSTGTGVTAGTGTAITFGADWATCRASTVTPAT